jgi:hypothetical protein
VAERFSCAAAARDRGEPCFATASSVQRWLLVEQPGPWGADAVLESRIERDVAVALKARAHRLRARLLLIRRFGRYEPEGHTVLVASSRPGAVWLERFVVREVAGVLDLDLSPLAEHRSVGGERLATPSFLVCTNGRHDICCAEYGRPLARTMSAVMPDDVWECSHVGGDRFAANLVCLPHGVYYGNVPPTEGVRIARGHARGRIDLHRYRGRSSQSFAVQAAEYLARVELDLDGLDALVHRTTQDLGDATLRVTFATEDGDTVAATVSVHPDEERLRLTCHAERLASAPRYELLALEVVSGVQRGAR